MAHERLAALRPRLDEPLPFVRSRAGTAGGGLTNLSPSRLQTLLETCRSVKVRRLFFFFADRHRHAWLDRLDKKAVDFGSGKRALVKGGKLDPHYLITVPGDLDGVS